MNTATEDVVSETLLLHTVKSGIATLTLNRPKQFNALSAALLSDLQTALDAIAAEKNIRVIVLAGAGRGFCAGHDLQEIQNLGDLEKIEALFHQCSRVMTTLAALPQPVIAKVHGVATAAGCQLVAACDLAIAADVARFAAPGVNIGVFCATPSVALGRNMHRKHAMEMLLTGEAIDAQQALAYGLVNRVVPLSELDDETDKLATLIAAKPPSAIASGKQMFYQQLNMGLAQAYNLASRVIACDFVSDNGREGVAAFLQKRPPSWK